ncbi:Arylsulfatase [Planctopirus ephydatiae]|uniref:Arylsulfatase n=1 Tax=Planctopirus ephydatiae TaxID=2528019 RepID=A0A518GNX1_9PLAN|nr:sulfatase [Planctopirus ephydatiae]QDV30229.1 Arylsulfatase [Planctopirus ephydatiae]
MKPILSLLTALLLAPLAAVRAEDTTTLPAKPNILWIVMDDVGVEMPCYGEKAIQTPNIDRLVHEGTTFTRAFLTSPVCSTARSAMITGMYQTTIGANNHVSGRGPHRIELPAGVEPVTAVFHRAGYYTSNGDYPLKSKGIGKTDYNFEWDHKMYDGNDWAGRKSGQPFFAQIQLWGGKNRNGDGGWYRNEALKALGTLTKPEEVSLPPYYPRDPVLLEDWAQYLDCIRLCDKQVGEILKRLETEGILDQTLIILMGDNGISHARGKQFLYDEGVRTPFIVRGPGIARGAVRTDLIEHIDMAATSLAWADLPVPAWTQGCDVFSPDYQKRAAVFAARDRCGETVDRIRSVRTEQFKYICNFYPKRPLLQPSNYKDTKPIIVCLRELHAAGKLNELQEKLLFAPSRPSEELYDVEKDPFETVNLAGEPQYAAILGELRVRLNQWSLDTKDPAPESAETYDLEMRSQVSRTKDPAEKTNVLRNIDLMKQWAKEGK